MKATTRLAAVALVVSTAIYGCVVDTATDCEGPDCVDLETQCDVPFPTERPELPSRVDDLEKWAARLAEGADGPEGEVTVCDAYFAKQLAEAYQALTLQTCEESLIPEAELFEQLEVGDCANSAIGRWVGVEPPFTAEAVETEGPPLALAEKAWVRIGLAAYEGRITPMQSRALAERNRINLHEVATEPGCAHLRN